MTRSTPRTLVAFVTAILAALALTLTGPAPQSHAVPPSGAGSNTPGTSSSVSNTVEVGGVVEFSLAGFPAGTTVSIKVDDGQGYSDQGTQGTGVVHQAVVPGSGALNGSFRLPSFVEPGEHWLRFLGSAPAPNGDGQVGYTNKSPNFTVVPAGSGNSGGGNSGGGGSQGGGSQGGNAGSQGGGVIYVDEEGATVTRDAQAEGEEEATDESAEPLVIDSSAAASTSAAPSSSRAADDSEKAAQEKEDSGFPIVGLVVLLIAILAVAVGVVLALRSRKQAESSAPAPKDEDPEATTEFKAQ